MSPHSAKPLLLAITLLAAAGTSCSSPFAPADFGDCTPQSSGEGEWSYLGLEGPAVTSLAETPWGLFAGSDSGVFRCHPESGRWRKLGLENHGVSSLVFLAGSTPRLLAGMNHHGEGASWRAISATENGGRTWKAWDSGHFGPPPDDRPRVFSLAVDPADPDHVFAGTNAAIARSTNAGRDWEFVLGDERSWGPGLRAIAISPRADGQVWVGGVHALGYALIHRTSDWGQTWQPVDPTPYNDNTVFSLAVDDLTSDRLWAGALGGVLYSEDQGVTWGYVDLPADPGRPIRLISNVLTEGSRIYAVGGTNHPFPDMRTDLVVFLSADHGGTWSLLETPSGMRGGTAALLSAGRLIVAVADGGGVWLYTPDD